MSSRHRIPVLIGTTAAAAALLLSGCASTGTVGAKPAAGSSSSSSPSTSDSSSSPSTDSSSSAGGMQDQLKMLAGMMTDPGCKTAVNALGDALGLQAEPLKMVGALPQVIQKMRQGAATTKKPEAKAAITKLADDLQNILNTASKGGTPDVSSMESDGAAFGTACIG